MKKTFMIGKKRAGFPGFICEKALQDSKLRALGVTAWSWYQIGPKVLVLPKGV